MGSGYTYHMCPVKGLFEILKLKEGGMVFFGNNKACKVQDIGFIKLMMFMTERCFCKK